MSAGTQVSQLLSLKVTALPAIRAVRWGGGPSSLPGLRRSLADFGCWHQLREICVLAGSAAADWAARLRQQAGALAPRHGFPWKNVNSKFIL